MVSSLGHIKDLPEKEMGVDFADFRPHFVEIPGKGKVIQRIRNLGAQAPRIYLGSDPDREGEAIAYHIRDVLDREAKERTERVEFHEITQRALQEALKKPRAINRNLVEAQFTRRILDRIVGYTLSPLLSRLFREDADKVFLSGGRVQSATLRLIVEREQERDRFVPAYRWRIFAEAEGIRWEVTRWKDEEAPFSELGVVEEILSLLRDGSIEVVSVEEKEVLRHPPPPFATVDMQQEAHRQFRWSPGTTMRLAQTLYEGVEIGKKRVGLITYMRTDSYRIAPQALRAVRAWIKEALGDAYLPPKPHTYRARDRFAQEAHEAIRPTDPLRTPEELKGKLDAPLWKLYDLIWRRFVASQLAPARLHQVTIQGKADSLVLQATEEILTFEGFYRLWPHGKPKHRRRTLPALKEGQEVRASSVQAEKSVTRPPSRYTFGSLVRAMQEAGIGRPSTYAPTIEILLKRGYIENVRGSLRPTALGRFVVQYLLQYFPDIVDVPFTARMEEELDRVERGERTREEVLQTFYTHYLERLQHAEKELAQVRTAFGTCKLCGAPLQPRLSRYGFFLGCSNYPKCRYIERLEPEENFPSPYFCPADGARLRYIGSFHKKAREPYFLKCPECEKSYDLSESLPGEAPCPLCGGQLVPRQKKGHTFWGCSRYPECTFTSSYPPLPNKCSRCQKTLFLYMRHGICLMPLCDGLEKLQDGEE